MFILLKVISSGTEDYNLLLCTFLQRQNVKTFVLFLFVDRNINSSSQQLQCCEVFGMHEFL